MIIYLVVIVLVVSAVFFFRAELIKTLQEDPTLTLWEALGDLLAANILSEIVSIAVTVLFIDQINRQQERRTREAEQKAVQAYIDEALRKQSLQQHDLQQKQRRQQLIDQMSSKIEGLPAEAIRLLKDHDRHLPEDAPEQDRWWDDRLVAVAIKRGGNLALVNLKKVDLENAHLRGAKLTKANLVSAQLTNANLSEAYLSEANLGLAKLSKSSLWDANLIGARLAGADFKEASLWKANLEDAKLIAVSMERSDLSEARLNNADLSRANLKCARATTISMLQSTTSLKGAILPDGTSLPYRDQSAPEPNWRTAFEEWCKTVPVDENGYIIPAPMDDEAE